MPSRTSGRCGRQSTRSAGPRRSGVWTATSGCRRVVAPVYSLMLATAPLPATFWDSVGLARRETFSDSRHVIIYGQRTADDRLAFGGRGAAYHFGSRVRASYDREPAVFAELWRVLWEMFPAAASAEVTHTWGGPLGVPRDWFASVGLDRNTGLAWAGGYLGDGVGPSSLAGRTLADLILRRDTNSSCCRGSGTGRPGGSRSRCAGSRSTSACE
jgi:glycine/D-amino acid oxidase-like deaminating enzyme